MSGYDDAGEDAGAGVMYPPGATEQAVPRHLEGWCPRPLVRALGGESEPTVLEAGYMAEDVDETRCILYEGKVHVVAGAPGSGKSWFGVVAAVDVIRGGDVVWWMDSDGMGRGALVERLEAFGLAEGLIESHVAYAEGRDPADAEELREMLVDRAETDRPRLVVIDSWGRSMTSLGLSQNDAQDVDRWGAAVLDPIRAGAPEAVVLIIDHTPKTRGEFTRGGPIGSQRKTGIADVVMAMSPYDRQVLTRESDGMFGIRVEKDRPGFHAWAAHGGELTLAIEPHPSGYVAHLWLPSEDGEGPRRGIEYRTGYMEKVSRHMEAEGITTDDAAITVRALRAALTGRNTYITDGLDGLIEAGYAVRVKGSTGTARFRLDAAYREGDALPREGLGEE